MSLPPFIKSTRVEKSYCYLFFIQEIFFKILYQNVTKKGLEVKKK